MAARDKPLLSAEDYLAIERGTEQKHQYYRGEVFAMGGASRVHNLIVMNTGAELRQQLKQRPCRVYASDLRVKVGAAGLYTYPDVIVACGEEFFDDAQKDTLLNPRVIVEVLSDSTEAYDRGEKFEHYRKLESLEEYVLIAQNKPHIECYRRQPGDRWLLSETDDARGNIELDSIGCRLALAEVYDKIEWPE